MTDGARRPDFVSRDGSPVAVYLAVPAGRAPSIIHAAAGDGASVLELGSGPGRLTRVLVGMGHPVVAVDDAEEMLAHVTGAERVLADVADLDLGRRFGAVVAASHLVNSPGDDARRRLLDVCRRHVADDGVVVLQRHAPGWVEDAVAGSSVLGPVDVALEPLDRVDGRLHARVIYTLAGRSWTQEFTAEDVDDARLATVAADVGLGPPEPLTDDGTWVALRPR